MIGRRGIDQKIAALVMHGMVILRSDFGAYVWPMFRTLHNCVNRSSRKLNDSAPVDTAVLPVRRTTDVLHYHRYYSKVDVTVRFISATIAAYAASVALSSQAEPVYSLSRGH